VQKKQKSPSVQVSIFKKEVTEVSISVYLSSPRPILGAISVAVFILTVEDYESDDMRA
jgi:hypothetical protein